MLPLKNGPGPWSYNLPSRIGKEGFHPLLHGKRSETKIDPYHGPGTYNPNFKAVLDRCPALSLSTGSRLAKDFSTKREIPGPGSYNLSSTLNGPKHKFVTSKRRRNVSEVPGPGSYKIPCSFAKIANYITTNRNREFKFV